MEELWIEDVQYEVYLLNKHATEGRKKYLEAKKWANKPRELPAEVFLSNPDLTFIKKTIKLLNCLKLKIVFEKYQGRNNFGVFWDK